MDEFEGKVLGNAVVTDNFDPSPTVSLDEWTRLTADQLNTPGTYRVWVSARDQAGNSDETMLYVRVYDHTKPEIWVNGVFAQPSETVFVAGHGSRDISVTLANLPTGVGGIEPHTMYWKSGLNTTGQMKNAQPFTTSFAAPRDGFYTVYIMTQSRNSYVIYVYLQS